MLVRLFSETNLIKKNVDFQHGINIILGDKGDTNGIGKSSLIRLVNYCLLSNSSETEFAKEKYNFLRKENHTITLEFKVDEQKYFIKRNFEKNKDLVWFGKMPNNFEEYTKEDLKSVLTNLFFPIEQNEVFFEGKRFGTLMNFFIKDDIDKQKQFDPLNFLGYASAGVTDKAIYNFFLLNISNKDLINFGEQASEYKKNNDAIKTLSQKIKNETGKEVEEYKTERLEIEKRINQLEQSVSDYKFIENYKNIEIEIIKISEQINERLKEYHALNRKLEKVRTGYQFNQEFDTNEIKKLYNEVYNTLGNVIAKSLEEVIDFKKSILENRNKYLINKERQIEKHIETVLSEISEIENRRSSLYKQLQSEGVLEPIESIYRQITEQKTELERNLQSAKQIEELQDMLASLNVTMSQTQEKIIKSIKLYQKEIDELRKLYKEILESTVFKGETDDRAYFDISFSKLKKNNLPIKFSVEVPRLGALGNERYKIVVYDLMVFLRNIFTNRKLPTFLVHDGAFHATSPVKVVNTLNYIFKKSLLHKFQYIATFNTNEIAIPENSNLAFDFDWKQNVIAEFSDNENDMIFKREIK